jgi:DNA-binding NarL/FixJ family response regulator
LRALVCGAANKTIAQQLGCAESTVEFHVTALLKKARVARRSELIAKFWTAF